MENDYNFWADLLSTYRANPDWLKFFWLFIPAALMTLCGHGLSRWIIFALGGRGGERGDAFTTDLPHTRLSSPPPRRRGPIHRLEERDESDAELLQPPETKRLPWQRDVDPRLRGDENGEVGKDDNREVGKEDN